MKLRFSKFDANPDPDPIRRNLLLGLCLVLAGCAEPAGRGPGPSPGGTRPMATLFVWGDVQVWHGGHEVPGNDGMALFAGDEVLTQAGSYAKIQFLDGDQVWLDYNTRVRVGSLFVFFGRVFAAVSGAFSVDSEFVAASTEGTEFTVSIDRPRRGAFSVALRQGILRCEPRAGRWRTVRMEPGERLSGEGRGQPTLTKLPPQEAADEFDWVARLRRTGRHEPPARVPPPTLRDQPQPSSRPPEIY